MSAKELPTRPLSVLFIGNSLTFCNDLPAMLDALARAAGRPGLEIGRVLHGGWTLEQHWRDGGALAQIRSRTWDLVVLQEQSTGTIDNPTSFQEHGGRFVAEIRAGGAQALLYQTWAWNGRPDDQVPISAAYRSLGEGSGAAVVPAGSAWAAWRRERGDDGLFTDNRHPTPMGTYLTACAFFAAIYQADPHGLPGDPAGLDEALARQLQRTAWTAAA